MSTQSATSQPVPKPLEETWKGLMGAGLVIGVLGLLAILTPFISGIALSILLGGVLVIAGIAHFGYAFSARGWAGSVWQLVLAVVYVIAGVAFIFSPGFGLVSLTLLLIAYLAITGLVEIVWGLMVRSEPKWGLYVLSGLVSVLLAGLLWAGFPSTAAWALGLLAGLSLLSTGLSLLYVAWVARRVSKRPAPGAYETDPTPNQ